MSLKEKWWKIFASFSLHCSHLISKSSWLYNPKFNLSTSTVHLSPNYYHLLHTLLPLLSSYSPCFLSCSYSLYTTRVMILKCKLHFLILVLKFFLRLSVEFKLHSTCHITPFLLLSTHWSSSWHSLTLIYHGSVRLSYYSFWPKKFVWFKVFVLGMLYAQISQWATLFIHVTAQISFSKEVFLDHYLMLPSNHY